MDVRDILTEKRLYQLKHMVSEIDVQQLQAKIDNGEIFKLIEVSNLDDFQAGHIAGAVHIPLAELKEVASQK
ncbi:rhodanese-like domain-containing protein, partial [candidate division KSB1 bacterium]|nr:rhodanese-like domain-containing protein [candidate division KSB1 bacterium]NIR70290.1 rhodanese-like domain-containing protein [candidate division KSB1 bacterium]NIS24451.1 rhodanese-like domain-containing protein [candidate division KSB1 bacterium]NIT71386.1 rhodanese-like domain-containing protein [candidate division KSB1 bacterium]NIU25071.1 rhodanese-like domain-containing protein [candidate division KSB1 bacterium]